MGFFTPRGIPHELIKKMDFGMLNVSNIHQIEESLERAKGSDFRIMIDFGPLITTPIPVEPQMFYRDRIGVVRHKVFEPLLNPKVLTFPDDEKLILLIKPYLDVMKKYKDNIHAVFLADEPYLNGISRAELERAAKIVRSQLNLNNLPSVKIGVIFASAMFDSEFAGLINVEAGEYAARIDKYYEEHKALGEAEFDTWVKTMEKFRLTTYDQAGNIYIEGGIPIGFDIVGFDFYLSTILLDAVHDRTLAWFANRRKHKVCAKFDNQTMGQIRAKLSFFQNGSVLQGNRYQEKDRKLLNAIFECRMRSVADMLKTALVGTTAEMLMISESSSNGVLEFDAMGNIEEGQPELLIEKRVLDEVVRAINFYDHNKSDFGAGLMFFTYDNEYDNTIALDIGGASAMPSVLRKIYSFVEKGK